MFPFVVVVVDKLVFFDLVVCCWSNFIKGSKPLLSFCSSPCFLFLFIGAGVCVSKKELLWNAVGLLLCGFCGGGAAIVVLMS